MAGETDNLPKPGGTDNAQPSTDIDNPSNWDFADPDEDQDNQEPPAKEGTAGETDEVAKKGDQEAEDDESEPKGEEEAEAEDDSSDGDADAESGKDDVLVTLSNGSKVQLSELKNGYLRQSDFTRKTQELANSRQALEAKADRINNTIDVFTKWLSDQLPKEPDIALSVSNPNEYVAQKAQYDAALSQVRSLVNLGANAKETKSGLSQDQRSELAQKEMASLVAAYPAAKSEKVQQELARNLFTVGKEIGFSEAEISQVYDHRIVLLARLARMGIDAERAREKAAIKVKDVPPVPPQKRSRDAAGAAVANRDAMRRLTRSGSFEDAMRVDFD